MSGKSMSYQVLARKWRPQKFTEVVGQEHVLRALINALDNDRLHHAYLLTGTRGVGKTTLGRILAKSLNCEQGVSSNPCGSCDSCVEITEGRFVDLLEVDAASRTKVEDTRELLNNVMYAPTRGRYKVYLIDEVHMLSNHSFNALLKTLEEPPAHVKFILATTDPQKLPVTILSRCLKFNLKCIPLDQISGYLQEVLKQEQVEFEEKALREIARSATGSMRDALSLLDQAISFGDGCIVYADVCSMLGTLDRENITPLMSALVDKKGVEVLEQIDQLAQFGVDFAAALDAFISLLHQIALLQVVPESASEQDDMLKSLAASMSPEDTQLYYQISMAGKRDLAFAPDQRAGFEMIMLRNLAFLPVSATSTVQNKPGAQIDERNIRKRARATAPPLPKESESKPETSAEAKIVEKLEQNSDILQESLAGAGPKSSWSEAIKTLKLSGLVKQLALNCVYLSREGVHLKLILSKEHSQLASKQLVSQFQDVLREHYKAPLVLNIKIGEVQEDTPAVTQEKEHKAKIMEAYEILEADPNVQGLKQMFNTKIDPDLIQLNDSK